MDPQDPIPSFIALQQQLPSARAQRQRELLLRVFMWFVAGCVLLAVAFGIVLLRFDPNAHRAQIEAAVRAATGREFHVRGQMAITSYRHMTIAASDVTFGNAPWGARPEMMRMGRVEADVGVVALMRGQLSIRRLVIEDADILLEVNQAGRGNWQFSAAAPALPATGKPAAPAPAAQDPVLIQALHLRDSHVTWHDSRTGRTQEVTLRRFTASGNPRDDSIALGAEVVVASQPIVINGTTSSLARLLDPGTTGAPWGVSLSAEMSGLRTNLAGTLAQPLEGRGYRMRMDGVMTDPEALAMVIGLPLPPLRGVTFSAELADDADGRLRISNLNVLVGTSNLDNIARGLQIEQASITAKTSDEPVMVEAKGTLTATDLRAQMRLGTLDGIVRGGQALPVSLLVTLGDSTLSVNGNVPALHKVEGLDVLVRAQVRDLSDLSGFARQRLPRMRPVSFAGRIATTGPHAIAFRDAEIGLPQAHVIADADIDWSGKPTIHGYLRGERLDIDGLLKAFSGISFRAPTNEIPLGALPIPRSVRPVISDTKLDLSWLGDMDVDLQATLDSLTLGGVQGRDVVGQMSLADRHLVIRPMSALLVGGPLTLSLDLDGGDPKLPVSLAVKAPALDLRAMLLAAGRTEDISGLVELNADLHGAGPSLHDIAGSLTGTLGVTLVNGQIDNVLLAGTLAGVGRAARVVSEDLFPPGRSAIRCFALKADMADGKASVPTLVLDAGRALIQGNGDLDFRTELLDMKLRPTLRVAPSEFSMALKLGGRLRAPTLSRDAPDAVADTVAGAPPAAAKRIATHAPDACPAALAAVRGAAGGLQPSQPPAAPLVPWRLLRLPAR